MDDAPAILTTECLGDAFSRVLAPGCKGLVLAVSGGPDSMALMRVSTDLARAGRLPPVWVATVDHGLRATATADAQHVADTASALGLRCDILRWIGEKPTTRVQERAREARYDLLLGYCRARGADHLATAHTLDDQAETVLFRLLRGSGVTGLGGMRPVTPIGGVALVRPLLGVTKARLVATCAASDMAICQDPANADPRFARARLRTLLPALAQEGGNAATFARLAARMARAEAALVEAAAAAFSIATRPSTDDTAQLDMRHLGRFAEDTAMRALAMSMASAGGGPLRLARLERMASHLRTQTRLQRSHRATLGGMQLSLNIDGVLTIAREPPRRAPATHPAAAPAGPFSWQA